FVIFADDTAVGGAGGRFELDRGVEGLQIARERVVAVEELFGSSFEGDGARGGGNGSDFGDSATTAGGAGEGGQCQVEHAIPSKSHRRFRKSQMQPRTMET